MRMSESKRVKMTENMKRLIKLVELRAEVIELLPFKANVYPVEGDRWGDGSKMGQCRNQISKLRELGYNKNRRKALQQIEREMVQLYNLMTRNGKPLA